MNSWLFHLITIPGIFLLGYLYANIRVVAFHTSQKERGEKSYE
ncbi:hypothetical protein [Shimazuella alba]|nr:hypothetical protein [Shimazuella alba]